MRIRGSSLLWLSLLSFIGSIISILVTDVNANPPAIEKESSCASGITFEDLKRQKELLDLREKELKDKELELKALEQGVREQFARLEQVGVDLSKKNELLQKESEEKVTKIVATVESMSPKAAAALIGSLDEKLAVLAMQRLETVKLAKIMNVMEVGKSSKLTELLAGVTREREKSPTGSSSNKSLELKESVNHGG